MFTSQILTNLGSAAIPISIENQGTVLLYCLSCTAAVKKSYNLKKPYSVKYYYYLYLLTFHTVADSNKVKD